MGLSARTPRSSPSCTHHSTASSLSLQRRVQQCAALFAKDLSRTALPVSGSQAEVDVTWETYSVEHFHGWLLMGCCKLACTNLSRVSEAAVPTQLCVGCTRARYCSMECQRTAWHLGVTALCVKCLHSMSDGLAVACNNSAGDFQ